MTPLEQKLQQLSLTAMSRQLEKTLAEAATRNLSVTATLEALADLELEARRQRAIERRFHLSRLQIQLSIDSFDFHHHKSRLQIKNRVLRLLDLNFLRQGTRRDHRQSWHGQDLSGQDPRRAGLPRQPARPVYHRHGHAQPPAGFPGRSLSDSQAALLHLADLAHL